MKKIFVVIPNWNGADMIGDCLESLHSQTQKHSVVVVDNGSVDSSVELLKSKFATVTLIELPENTGFAGGVNVGIRHALEQGADAIALFNNDAVADKDWLQELTATMDANSEVGIVTCKLLRTDKKHFDSTGDFYSIWGMPFPRARNVADMGQFDAPEEVFGASGGASLYRAEMLERIGVFDEKFFAYLEDVDISFRAQLAGWKVFYNPRAIAYHQVGGTSSKLGSFSRYHFVKNFYLLYGKNMPGWLYWKYLPRFTIQAMRMFASAMLKGGGLAYTRGVTRAFLNTPHIIKERRRIQASRTVSTQYIDSILYKNRPPKIPKI